MKWSFINGGAPGDGDFGPADRIVDFAVANGFLLRGHNLLWYHRTPRWRRQGGGLGHRPLTTSKCEAHADKAGDRRARAVAARVGGAWRLDDRHQ
jgi:GH35 family endo-1,4-beta-xylanase